MLIVSPYNHSNRLPKEVQSTAGRAEDQVDLQAVSFKICPSELIVQKYIDSLRHKNGLKSDGKNAYFAEDKTLPLVRSSISEKEGEVLATLENHFCETFQELQSTHATLNKKDPFIRNAHSFFCYDSTSSNTNNTDPARMYSGIEEIWDRNHHAVIQHPDGYFCYPNGWAAREILYRASDDKFLSKVKLSRDAFLYELNTLDNASTGAFLHNPENSYLLHLATKRLADIWRDGISVPSTFPQRTTVHSAFGTNKQYIALHFDSAQPVYMRVWLDPYLTVHAEIDTTVDVTKLVPFGQEQTFPDQQVIIPTSKRFNNFQRGFDTLCKQEASSLNLSQHSYTEENVPEAFSERVEKWLTVLTETYEGMTQSNRKRNLPTIDTVDCLAHVELLDAEHKVQRRAFLLHLSNDQEQSMFCNETMWKAFPSGTVATVVIEDAKDNSFRSFPLYSPLAIKNEINELKNVSTDWPRALECSHVLHRFIEALEESQTIHASVIEDTFISLDATLSKNFDSINLTLVTKNGTFSRSFGLLSESGIIW